MPGTLESIGHFDSADSLDIEFARFLSIRRKRCSATMARRLEANAYLSRGAVALAGRPVLVVEEVDCFGWVGGFGR